MEALLVVLILTVLVVLVVCGGTSTKARRKLDESLTKVRRKLDNNLTKVRLKFDESLTKARQSSTKTRRKFDDKSTKLYFVILSFLLCLWLDVYFICIWSALANLLRNLNLRHAPSDPSRCDSMSPLRAAFQTHNIMTRYQQSVYTFFL